MRTFKFTSLALLIIAISLFAGTPISYSSSNDDNHLSANDSIYSPPGYMNKDIQQARTLTDKYLANKDKADNKTEATQRDVSQKVQTQAVDKPKPELKQKQSSAKGKSNTQAAVAAAAADNANSADIPAYIQNSVQEYIERNGANGSVGYQIKSANGKYYAFWNGRDSSNKSFIKFQVFDSAGNTLSSTPSILVTTRDYASLSNITTLSNRNVAVFWNEYDYGSKKYSLKSQVFDSAGNTLSSTPSILANSKDYASLSNVSTLANSNIAVFWEETDLGSKRYLKSQLFDSSGNTLSSTPNILANNMDRASIYKVTTLASGNIAVFWSEYDSISKYSLKSQLFNSAGNTLSSTPNIIASNRYNAFISNITTLANGNIAVLWSETDLNYKYSIKSQLFDSGGKTLSSMPNIITSDKHSASISNVTTLANGNIAVFWTEYALNKYTLKSQLFDSGGNALSLAPNTIASNGNNAAISNVTALANGNIAAFWREIYFNGSSWKHALKSQLFDSAGNKLSSTPNTLTSNTKEVSIYNITTLANGSIAVSWTERDSNNMYSLKAQLFDSGGSALSAVPSILTSNKNTVYIYNITTLANGNLSMFWSEYDASSKYSLKSQLFDSAGNKLSSTPNILASNKNSAGIASITTLASGNIAVFWQEADQTGKYYLKSQVLDSLGNFGSANALNVPTSLLNTAKNPLITPLINPYSSNTLYGKDVYSPFITGTALFNPNIKDISTITKALLLSKDMLKGMMDKAGPVTVEKIVKESLNQSALALPGSQIDPQVMEMAMRLANIMKNPTDSQRVTIDSIKALLNDINKIEDASGNQSPDLKKATDDLLNAVANILLAQAMPDLIKQGDVSNIKAMFSELDTQRNKIMLDYSTATKPYYENMIKDLAKNMAMLQGKNLLNPNMSKEELSKLPPSELDKILDKIRNMKDKSFEEEYLLQQEAKYRHDYLDPNNKKLESDMKGMLRSFTGRINDVLKSADKK